MPICWNAPPLWCWNEVTIPENESGYMKTLPITQRRRPHVTITRSRSTIALSIRITRLPDHRVKMIWFHVYETRLKIMWTCVPVTVATRRGIQWRVYSLMNSNRSTTRLQLLYILQNINLLLRSTTIYEENLMVLSSVLNLLNLSNTIRSNTWNTYRVIHKCAVDNAIDQSRRIPN